MLRYRRSKSHPQQQFDVECHCNIFLLHTNHSFQFLWPTTETGNSSTGLQCKPDCCKRLAWYPTSTAYLSQRRTEGSRSLSDWALTVPLAEIGLSPRSVNAQTEINTNWNSKLRRDTGAQRTYCLTNTLRVIAYSSILTVEPMSLAFYFLRSLCLWIRYWWNHPAV